MNRNDQNPDAVDPELPDFATPDSERYPPGAPETSEANDDAAFEADDNDEDVDDENIEDDEDLVG